jgi:hypothetical protein
MWQGGNWKLSAKTAGFLNIYFSVENIGKYFPLKIPFIKSVKELKRRGFRVHLPETFLYIWCSGFFR